MLPAFLLAALISISAAVLQYVYLFKFGYAGISSNPTINFIFYAVVYAPVFEENCRYAAVSLAQHGGHFLKPSFRTAALIGFFIGAFEFLWKSRLDFTASAAGFDLVLSLSSNASSFPIHIALSCAFFSFRSHQLLKTMGLHALVNFSALVAAVVLEAMNLGFSVSPVGNTAAVLAVVTAVSLIIVARSFRRMRLSLDR